MSSASSKSSARAAPASAVGLSMPAASRTRRRAARVGHAGEAIICVGQVGPAGGGRWRPASVGRRQWRSGPARWGTGSCRLRALFGLVGLDGQGGALVGAVVSLQDGGQHGEGVLGGAVAVGAFGSGADDVGPVLVASPGEGHVEGVAAGAGADDGVGRWRGWRLGRRARCRRSRAGPARRRRRRRARRCRRRRVGRCRGRPGPPPGRRQVARR